MDSLRGQGVKLATRGELVSRLRTGKAVLHVHICSYGMHKHRVLEDSYTPDENSFPFSFEIIIYLFRLSTSIYDSRLTIRDVRTAVAEKSISF